MGAASYKGRRPASARTSAAARAASRKKDTRCELLLRRELWAAGLRYRKHAPGLPGRPDVVFPSARVAVFCDGDFWHGRDWETRKARLRRGTNADYWTAKIEGNMARDRVTTERLVAEGWLVVRVWETDILKAADIVAARVAALVRERRGQRQGEIGAGFLVGEASATDDRRQ